jgi:hypothetical protein
MQIRQALPFKISYRPTASTAQFQDQFNSYDFALGGVPFLSAVDGNHPFTRSTAQFKKDQIDQGSEPGEQTLTGWWLRSQSSFHFGTGLVYEDPALDPTAQFRFSDSEGVNVWTLGQFSLLKSMSNVAVGGTTGALAVGVAGSINGVLYAYDTNLKLVDASGTITSITYGGAHAIQSVCTDGRSWFVGCDDGIYTGDMTTPGVAGTKLWTVSSTTTLVRWVKNRLMAGINNKIYELVTPGGGAPFALPGTATYSHPNTNYVWNDIDEGPNAIYAVGFLGTDSSILKITVDSSGLLPTLTSANTVATLPRNEIGYTLYGYLGSFLIIGTSLGVRVATISTASVSTIAGDISYGPLIPTTQPVRDMVGKDHYIFAGFSQGMSDGTSGVIRIDLAAQLPNGRYAYAKDLMTHVTGTVIGVTTVGTSNRLAIATLTNGLYFESATSLETTGYLQTARIRYNTVWPKLFKKFSLRGDITGSVSVSSVNDQSTVTPLVTLSSTFDQLQDLNVSFPDGPQEWMGLKIMLTRADSTHGPTIRSYQLKALPGGPRQRNIIMPLLCYDSEKDREMDTIARQGWASQRLAAVEAMDSAGEVILWEDLRAGTVETVVIDQIEFRQVAPPGPNAENWGGILTVQLRTLD